MNNPLLSIIIPVYNVEKYVGKCLESIFSQDADESMYEVIVVNDGTKDNSMDIVKPILAQHKHAMLIEQENQKLSVARNNGLNAAKGDYVWFVDSDDTISKGAISGLCQCIKQYKAEVYVFSVLWIYEGNKTQVLSETLSKRNRKYYTHINNGFFYEQKLPVGLAQRFCLKRSFLINNNLYFLPNVLHEDMDYIPRIYAYAERICPIKDTYYNYMIREQSITTSLNPKKAEDYLKILSHLYSIAQNNKNTNKKRYLQLEDAINMLAANFLSNDAFKVYKDIYGSHKKGVKSLERSSFFISFFAYPSLQKIKQFIKSFII